MQIYRSDRINSEYIVTRLSYSYFAIGLKFFPSPIACFFFSKTVVKMDRKKTARYSVLRKFIEIVEKSNYDDGTSRSLVTILIPPVKPRDGEIYESVA